MPRGRAKGGHFPRFKTQEKAQYVGELGPLSLPYEVPTEYTLLHAAATRADHELVMERVESAHLGRATELLSGSGALPRAAPKSLIFRSPCGR